MNMTKGLILKNHAYLEENVEKIIKYGLRIIDKNNFNKFESLDREEKKLTIEGLLLRACAFWEKFMENEVIYLVELDTNKLLEKLELSLNTTLNRNIIRAIILSDKYRDFHDIERSKSFFKTYITDQNNVFTKLTTDQKDKG